MNKSEEPILRLPESVKHDTFAYRANVEKYLRGETSPVAFRAYRVPMGIYEQRTAGEFMVRIRVGAGLLLAYQAKKIAELSKKHGNGIIHITTRQDIQIHEVDIERTADVLEGLLEAGLSARGGGGNTVRNVTACPRCGVCPNERFDVAPYAIAAAEYLIQDRSSFNLPRKYKIVFSGCPQDCAFASVADLGFFAQKRNGALGFSAYAGGGLGSNPAVAVKIEDFIEANDVFLVTEAIKRLFDEHGDRSDKHKARLRYVVGRLGADEFVQLYKSYRDQLIKEGLSSQVPQIRDLPFYSEPQKSQSNDIAPSTTGIEVLEEKQPGFISVRLNLKLGDISADDFVTVADITQKYGQGLIRTTQLQNLIITSVPTNNLKDIEDALSGLSIDISGKSKNNIVACTGAATCKLGLCLSRGLTAAISDKLNDNGVSTNKTVVRISGCPNSCGHHFIADIGFQGRAKRISGRLMPCYDVLTGAKTVESEARLAKKIGTIPAKRIPEMLVEVFSGDTKSAEQLKRLIADYDDFTGECPEDYFSDYGSGESFTLAGRGPGECGAGVMDIIRVDIDQAKDALKTATGEQADANLYKAVLSAAGALLFLFGQEPKKDREVISAFREHLIKPGWVTPEADKLLDAVLDWRIGDRDSITDLAGETDRLVTRVEKLFLSLDANLKFKIKPVSSTASKEDTHSKSSIVDLRGVACPLNFVKAKLALEQVQIGQTLEFLLDEGEPIKNVPDSFVSQGQEVIEKTKLQDHYQITVKRVK